MPAVSFAVANDKNGGNMLKHANGGVNQSRLISDRIKVKDVIAE